MNTKAKSIVILLSTFVLGGLIGGLVVGMVSQQRTEKIGDFRKKGGFIRHMERVIEPKDSAEHEVIHSILEETDARNRKVLENAHREMKASYDSMLVELEPHISDEQMNRLKAEHERMKKRMKRGRKGPPGFPHSGRRKRNRELRSNGESH